MAVRTVLAATVVAGVLAGAFPGGAAAVIPDEPSGGPAVTVARSSVAAVPSPPTPIAAGWMAPTTPIAVLRRFVVGPRRWSPGHRGVDLAGSAGSPVRAAGGGVVTFAGPIAGRGVVVLGHPHGLRTTYEPVAATVHRGEPVAAGQVLGTLAATGSHCTPATCLHWGALAGETYLDPLVLLGLGPPPVLLPMPRRSRTGRVSPPR
jgi:murein DD-endopeptidase MepM/ murein hydrolase activator NlpD